ncbi:coiled-coil domain-containing protein [Rosistilla ulvae]|uniref:hypothetical protein n=1 Tax=Rosistilla ulvae TaxID=1930277 RepID=UPI00119F3C69|nr:hypothetical protein [Rosistilla ulvae]
MSTSFRSLPRAVSGLALLILAASAADAQYQALAHGERIISVGPPIESQPSSVDSSDGSPAPPCTIDCERAANRAADSPSQAPLGKSVMQMNPPENASARPDAPAAKPAELPGPRDLAAELREATSKFEHEMKQAKQQIDSLTQRLQKREQEAAAKQIDTPQVEQLQSTIAAMRREHAKELSAADARLKTLVDEVSVGLAATRKENQARELALKSELTKQTQSIAKKVEAAKAEAAQKLKAMQEQSEQLEAAKNALVQRTESFAKQAQAAKLEAAAKAKANQELAMQLDAAKQQHAQQVVKFTKMAEVSKAQMIEQSKAVDAMNKQVRELRADLAGKTEALENNIKTSELLEKKAAALEKEHQAALDQLKQANKKNESLQRRQKALEKELTALKRQRDADRPSDKKRKPKKKRDDK